GGHPSTIPNVQHVKAEERGRDPSNIPAGGMSKQGERVGQIKKICYLYRGFASGFGPLKFESYEQFVRTAE
ncbi:MAG TPA: hypothetical protein VL547_23520, partial [Dinghuibacter sp.]|uniref:hypothetical protein n=1 Tax=Dinghuibacter sp. TaxID=2024697 RepID=UPI002C378E44